MVSFNWETKTRVTFPYMQFLTYLSDEIDFIYFLC